MENTLISEVMTNFMAWVKLNWILLLFLTAIAGAFIFLRTKASNIDDTDELSGLLHDGQPTVIEFYSNFWATCLVAKPIVDGLENELDGKADVIRLNAMTSIGRQAAAHFGARGLPTLVLVDGSGEVVLTQVGIIRSGPILEQVDQLIAP